MSDDSDGSGCRTCIVPSPATCFAQGPEILQSPLLLRGSLQCKSLRLSILSELLRSPREVLDLSCNLLKTAAAVHYVRLRHSVDVPSLIIKYHVQA